MTLLRWFDATTRAPGFGDRAMVALALAVLTFALLLEPSDAAVTLFGWEVPVSCAFRRLTGVPCPGCGLTRSFVYLAHGQALDAFRMNLLGPFAFTALLVQAPWRVWRLWRRRQASAPPSP